jgi:hypothetical protein
MTRTTLTALAVTFSLVTGTARADDDEAKATAETLLAAGAWLFDAKDAGGLADTDTDDAVVAGLTRDTDTRKVKVDVVRGRAVIEKTYRDLFKGDATFHARNTVRHAHKVAPDVLVIAGQFEPDAQAGDPVKVLFAQVRVRQGDAWKVASLELLLLLDR